MWDCPGAFHKRTNTATQALTMAVVGPAAQRLLWAAGNCTDAHCSGNGRCTTLVHAAPHVSCRCFAGWRGADCSQKSSNA
eukprot:SAG22_NODE_2319_length_2723_cov_11.996189_2_plen_80_part_00